MVFTVLLSIEWNWKRPIDMKRKSRLSLILWYDIALVERWDVSVTFVPLGVWVCSSGIALGLGLEMGWFALVFVVDGGREARSYEGYAECAYGLLGYILISMSSQGRKVL
jgi:hypothetical protein